jgi:serine protease DegQ
VSDPDPTPAWRQRHNLILIGAVGVAAAAGGLIGRSFAPATGATEGSRPRPIIQIARPQSSLPSLADSINRVCPSVAAIVPHDGDDAQAAAPKPATSKSGKAAASGPTVPPQGILISADGWIIFAGSPASGALDALFGDGRRVPISDLRSDPVSGLTVARTGNAGDATPITLSDQSFPRIGDFGFAVESPNGTGCSAVASMMSSDFLIEGGGQAISIRLQQNGNALPPGAPFFSVDGRVIGIALGGSGDTLIPAPIAAIIVDELIRNSPSPLLAYGFRAVDLTNELASRLGDVRARGVAVAVVEPHSSVDRAGLQAGDIVAAVNGSPISSASELSRALDAATGTASLTVTRGDRQLTMKVSRSLSGASAG